MALTRPDTRASGPGDPPTPVDDEPRLVSVAVTAPGDLDPLAWTMAGRDRRSFWAQPDAGFTIGGRGIAHSVHVPVGPDRFATASRHIRRIAERAEGPDQPFLVGGMAFSPGPVGSPDPRWAGFGPGRFIVPAAALVQRGDRSELIVTRALEGGRSVADLREELQRKADALLAEPVGPVAAAATVDPTALDRACRSGDRDHYLEAVAAAVREIHAGRLSKVVVARALRIDHRPDIGSLLARLRDSYPTCATFLVEGDAGSFVGATPERLVAVDGARTLTAALAGSAPRDTNRAIDDALGHALLASPKERAEHDFVVDAVRSSLETAGVRLDAPIPPRILKLAGIQHLYTPIGGDVPAGATALDLAGALHPTPAVGGIPARDAQGWLDEHEGLDRGWYASPIGWLGADGSGELRVALRSGVIDRQGTTLFAGAGVVAGSDPHRELTETDVKLRAMLGPVLAASREAPAGP